MGTTEGSTAEEPLLKPRVIRFLKNRERVVDLGFREEFWDVFEERVREKRKPANVASKTARGAAREVSEAATPAVRNKAQKAMERANEGALQRL